MFIHRLLIHSSTNIPPTIEEQVRFISDVITTVRCDNPTQAATIEATPEAENAWMDLCNKLCKDTLFHRSASWIFGANIPGKQYATRFYFGGLKAYRDYLAHDVGKDLKGFKIQTVGRDAKPTETARL